MPLLSDFQSRLQNRRIATFHSQVSRHDLCARSLLWLKPVSWTHRLRLMWRPLFKMWSYNISVTERAVLCNGVGKIATQRHSTLWLFVGEGTAAVDEIPPFTFGL